MLWGLIKRNGEFLALAQTHALVGMVHCEDGKSKRDISRANAEP
jgi:hypothetical protein